jgi:membrane protein YdbS with pleckstrin-like domain
VHPSAEFLPRRFGHDAIAVLCRKQDEKKLKILSYNEHKVGRMNWWGMFFAFLSIVVTIGLAAYALYLDRAWFAGVFGLAAVASIASIFINNKK